MSDETHIDNARQALRDSPDTLRRLGQLRGWTPEAIERLGLGLDHDRVLLAVRDAEGRVVGLLRYQPNPDRRADEPKMMAAPGSQRQLFPAPESLPADGEVWIVEGEADAVAAHSAGLAATAVPGTGSWNNEWAERFAGRDVIVCCDCDQPGRGLAQRVADTVVEHAASVRVLDLNPARDDGHDLSDVVLQVKGDPGAAHDALQSAIDDLPGHVPTANRPPSPRLSVEQFRRAVRDYLTRPAEPAWPIPWTRLNEDTDGGIRPGEVWVVSAHTSIGKSIVVDAISDHAALHGARVHQYLTEMTVVQRGLRMVTRRTGIPMGAMRRRDLTGRQLEQALFEVDRLPYAATVVNGWKPDQVAADIRASRTNIAVIDLLHGFDYDDERQLSNVMSALARGASSDAGGLNGSAVIVVAQLNRTASRDGRRVKPNLSMLKQSSWIEQLSDVILFVHREDDPDTGVPVSDGEIWIAKQRNGPVGASVKVELNPTTLEFEDVLERQERERALVAAGEQGAMV